MQLAPLILCAILLTSCANMRDREGQSMAWFECLTQHEGRYCLGKY